MPFPEPLIVAVISGGKYKVLEHFPYDAPNGERFTAPAGMLTDFASIPRIFRPFLTGHGSTRRPAVIHDHLYHTKTTSRAKADKIFLQAMSETNTPALKRYLAYTAVRIGGWVAWNSK